MTKTYNYILQYKDDEERIFNKLIECLPYIETCVNHQFITRDVLNDYLTKARPRHQVLFANWKIKRDPIVPKRKHQTSLPQLVSAN